MLMNLGVHGLGRRWSEEPKLCNYFPSNAACIAAVHHQRAYGRTDGQMGGTDLRWQWRALHYVHRAVKMPQRGAARRLSVTDVVLRCLYSSLLNVLCNRRNAITSLSGWKVNMSREYFHRSRSLMQDSYVL